MSLENSCRFKGNLVADPELRYTPSSVAVLNFTVAVNRTYTKKDKTKGRETFFAPLEIWAEGAEYIAKNFVKGDKIEVECSAKTDKWTDKDNQPKSRIKFRVNQFSKLARFTKNSDDDSDVDKYEHAGVSDDEPF